MKNKTNQQLDQYSITDYLALGHRKWYIEMDTSDFGASVARILDIPIEIYNLNRKIHFWAFINDFLKNSAISFIFRESIQPNGIADHYIELALIGTWEGREFAIPLWIMEDLLLIGFEVLQDLEFSIIDANPLRWYTSPFSKASHLKIHKDIPEYVILSQDIFLGDKIYLILETVNNACQLTITTDFFRELELFDRITQIDIPELDELEED